MKITLDTELCSQYNLTLEQALLLNSKINPSNNLEETYVLNHSRLETLDVSKVESIYQKIKSKKPSENEKWALEFWEAFPKTCTGPDGNKRFLRQGILKRKALSEYKKLVKTIDEHRMALEYLQFDIRHRKETDSLKWICSIVKYIEDHPWSSTESKTRNKDGFIFGGDIV